MKSEIFSNVAKDNIPQLVQVLSSVIEMADKSTRAQFAIAGHSTLNNPMNLDKAVATILDGVRIQTQHVVTDAERQKSAPNMYIYERSLQPLLSLAEKIRKALHLYPQTSDPIDTAGYSNEAFEKLGQFEINLGQYEQQIVTCFEQWKAAVEENIAEKDVRMPLAENHLNSVVFRRDKTTIRGVEDLISGPEHRGIKAHDFVEISSAHIT